MELIKRNIKRIDSASNIFRFKNGVEGFSITNGVIDWMGDYIRVSSTTSDPYICRNVSKFSGSTYHYIHIKYRVVTGTPTSAQIFYGIDNGHSYSGDFYKNFSIVSDKEWHVEVVDMSTLSGSGVSDDWITHEINQFRYDPTVGENPTVVDVEYIIISDSYLPVNDTIKTGMTYQLMFGLKQDTQDIGFFDAYELTGSYQYVVADNNFYSYLTGGTSYSSLSFNTSTGMISGTTNDDDYSGYTYTPYIVTGGSTSRLNELEKYKIDPLFNEKYVSGGNWNTDGVDYVNTIQNVRIVYYLGGIQFVDTLTGVSSGTTFQFTGVGITSPDFINLPIYKNPAKENIISNPKINDDVFIVRQELSAFENNYRLEHIKNLGELLTYAGGKYFNIISNT